MGLSLGRKQGEGWEGNRLTWPRGKSDNSEGFLCGPGGKWVTWVDRQIPVLPLAEAEGEA